MSAVSLPRGDAAPIVHSPWTAGYPGSKGGAGVSEKLISLMPRHRTYIAGFAGHDAIYWRKKRAERSIAVDVDAQVYSWWSERAPEVLAVQGDFLAIAKHDPRVRRLLRKKDTLLYLDPPYLRETRSDRAMWLYEMDTPEEHTQLLTLAKSLPCMVMISGYWSGLYESWLMYEGSHWRFVTYTVTTRGGPREECCWMNFPEGLELHDTSFAGWDYRERERIKKKRTRWVRNLLAMSSEERQAIMVDLQTALTIAGDEDERGRISDPAPPAPVVAAGIDADGGDAGDFMREENEQAAIASGGGVAILDVPGSSTTADGGEIAPPETVVRTSGEDRELAELHGGKDQGVEHA